MAIGARCPPLHAWARDFVFNPRYWSADSDASAAAVSATAAAAAAAQDASIIELLKMVHGNAEEIAKLVAVLRGELLLLLLILQPSHLSIANHHPSNSR